MKPDENIRRMYRYLLPSLLAAALVVTAVWGARQKAKAEEYFDTAGEYMGAVGAVYDRCLNELEDDVNDMQVSLAKLRVSASEEQTVLALEDIVSAGGSAAAVMSRLPRTHAATEELMKFLVRTGDYARCLSRRVLAGERLSSSDVDCLEQLYEACAGLSSRLRAAADGGEQSFDILAASGYYADEETDSETMLCSDGESGGSESASAPEYPSLIYDGPFSESTEKAEPKGLTGDEVTEEEAQSIAEKLTGTRLEPAGTVAGKIPVYTFASAEGENSCSVSVTVTGGRVLWFMRDAEGGEMPLPDEEEYSMLCAAGIAWLDSAGYTSMTPTYAMYYNGMALISYVFEKDGVRYYNDLVKVWIARGSNEIIGADANNYLFSHRERRLPAPELDEEQARALASPRLEVDAVKLALIPLSPMTEGLCYEMHGFCGRNEYVVYINALTGSEDAIFQILSDQNGRAAV